MQSFHIFCFSLINGRMERVLDSVSQKDFMQPYKTVKKKRRNFVGNSIFEKSTAF